MTKKRNPKIVKYRKPFQVNIGVVIFIFIFLYLMYYVFSYFTTEHISAYEVTQGTIAQDRVFHGLILRDETVYYADRSGYVNYYCKAGSKAGTGSYVYSIDETGDFYRKMSASADSTSGITSEAYKKLTGVADQYLASYTDNNFHQVYQFKYDLEAALVEALNSNARNEILSMTDSDSYPRLHIYTAEAPGIIVYYTDGLETVTADDFTEEMFDLSAYQKNNFLQRETIAAGEPIYKMINSEYWKVIIPIDTSLAVELAETQNIRVEFSKDNTVSWASSQILNRNGKNYLSLEFSNSMIRFSSDRYIELKLLIDDTTGLKIPNSSITEKEFFTVPKNYVTKGGNSNKNGLLIQRTDKNGNTQSTFIETTLIYETEEDYYADSDELRKGDVVICPDSNERYTLSATGTLEGVYNINKGYAVFRRIEKLYENQEYTIIKSGTTNGISLYDHIALDSSTVSDGDIIN